MLQVKTTGHKVLSRLKQTKGTDDRASAETPSRKLVMRLDLFFYFGNLFSRIADYMILTSFPAQVQIVWNCHQIHEQHMLL